MNQSNSIKNGKINEKIKELLLQNIEKGVDVQTLSEFVFKAQGNLSIFEKILLLEISNSEEFIIEGNIVKLSAKAIKIKPVTTEGAYDLSKFFSNDSTPLIVVDFETTGYAPPNASAIEIGAVKLVNGEIKDTFTSLINPRMPIPEFIQKMTGISQEMVEKAPSANEVFTELRDWLPSTPYFLLAHNAPFDRKFFEFHLTEIGYTNFPKFICSLQLARKTLVEPKKKNLGSLAEFFGVNFEDTEESSFARHRALGDAVVTAKVFTSLCKIAVDKGILNLEYVGESTKRKKCKSKKSKLEP